MSPKTYLPKNKLHLLLLLFLSLASFSIQKIDLSNAFILPLGETAYSSLNANGNNYYYLTLEKVEEGSQLIVEVEPNPDIDVIDNIISDPNLYIFYENDVSNSWSSKSFGDEIVSISSKYLVANKRLIINVNCPKSCNYVLKTQMVKSINLKSDVYNTYTVNKNSVMKFDFKTKNQFNKLTVNVVSTQSQYFRAYLALENPSTENTLKSKPVLSNGYAFTISKTDSYYKVNTNYELLIENEGKKVEVNIWLKYDDGESIKVKEASQIFEVLEKGEKSCYYFTIDSYGENKDLIFSSMLFNGQAFMQFGGWTPVTASQLDVSKDNENRYQLYKHRAINLKSELRSQKFGNFNKMKPNDLHFCIYANEETSLSLRIYYLNQANDIQNLNIVYPGITIEDYLPKNTLTKYRLEDFDIKRDIYIYLNTQQGKQKLYLIYEIGEPKLYDTKTLDYEMRSGRHIEGGIKNRGSYLEVKKEKNLCLETSKQCQLSVIVFCENESECVYELYYDHESEEISMAPRVTYDNVISEAETDFYIIKITDPSVKNIAIVLTQNTGSCSIELDTFKNDGGLHDITSLNSINTLTPNIIKINAMPLKIQNLVGVFRFHVTGHTYASYSVYYYPYNPVDEDGKLDHNTVSSTLERGEILHDVFLDEQRYKLYYFDNSKINGNKTDLFLTLVQTSKINVELYIYKEISDFYMDNKKNVKGYLYYGKSSDYVYIEKNDENHLKYDKYYILIYKKTETNAFSPKNTFTDFYIGITDENTAFTLTDGIEFRHYLTRKHNKQKFKFNYIQNAEKDVKVSINVIYGNIKARAHNFGEDYDYDLPLTGDENLITLPQVNDCIKDKNSDKCSVEIEVFMDETYKYKYSAEFIIACQSSSDVPIQIIPGVITKRQILTGEEQHFILDANTNFQFTKITVFFTLGVGEIYARRLLGSESISTDYFPNKNNYEYTAKPNKNSRAYTIEIPQSDIKANNGRKILLTVSGGSPDINSLKIEYTISISNTIKELEIDKSYRLFTGTGEITIFHFKVTGSKKRLYISMTNKDQDANMFLNYGPNLPNTIYHRQWQSTGAYNEYLDININDPFFVAKQATDLDGEYYLTIQALGECFYNLYVSTEDIKIMKISNTEQAGCECQKANDICYFRYENNENVGLIRSKEKDLVFYSEYTYGHGNMYAKLYENSNMYEILNNLPNTINFDYSSYKKYLRFVLKDSNEKYTKDSIIILALICKEKSLLDMSVAEKTNRIELARNTNRNLNLNLNKDNLYFLSSFTGGVMTFYHYTKKNIDLDFQIRVLYDSADFHTYINNTDYKSQKEKRNFYHHIADFSLNVDDDKTYSGRVPSNYAYENYFYVDVKPKGDCLFIINLHYNEELKQIPLNKEISGTIGDLAYNAYFDFIYEVDEVILTVTGFDPSNVLSIFIKSNLVNKQNTQQVYNTPSETNFDQKGTTNELTQSLSLRIKNVPKDIREKFSTTRVLISVISKLSYPENNKITVMVSPVLNNISRIKPNQKLFYFTTVEYKNKIPNYAVFELTKENSEDDLMIIELSACKGQYYYKISEKPFITGEEIQNYKDVTDSRIHTVNGKKIILIKGIPVTGYYLAIYPEKMNIVAATRIENKVDILISYYTTEKNKFNQIITDDMLHITHEGSLIKIFMPVASKKDVYGAEDEVQNLDYTVVFSESYGDYIYMSSTCYLRKMYENKIKNTKFYDEVKINFNKEDNCLTVQGLERNKKYYVNVLVRNEDTGEIFTYIPAPVVLESSFKGLKTTAIIILIILCVIFSCLAFRFYRKYRINSLTINYGIGDGKENTGKVTNINLQNIKKKYNTLSEDNNES